MAEQWLQNIIDAADPDDADDVAIRELLAAALGASDLDLARIATGRVDGRRTHRNRRRLH
jgi:hypothetical protein